MIDYRPTSDCDDGDRVIITNKAYGACVVTLLRGLKEADCLDGRQYPSLETLLRNVYEWSITMDGNGCPCDYGAVCKAIGNRLFGGTEAENKALAQARLQEWTNTLDPTSQNLVRRRLKEITDEEAEAIAEGKSKEPWFAGANEGDEDEANPDFVLSRVWKEYKQYLAGSPSMPLRGPPNWDISSWTAEQKRLFEFDARSRGDDDEED